MDTALPSEGGERRYFVDSAHLVREPPSEHATRPDQVFESLSVIANYAEASRLRAITRMSSDDELVAWLSEIAANSHAIAEAMRQTARLF